MSEQLNSCQETQYSDWKKDNRKTTNPDVQLNSTRLTQVTVFHNSCRDQHQISAPPLVCARSGYMHTICSDVTQTVVSHYSAELSHRQDRPRCRPDDSCRSRIRNSASHAIRFHTESRSGHFLMMRELIVHLDVVTQYPRRFPSADFTHLTIGIRKRSARQHLQDHNDHSHTDPEPAARLAHILHVPDWYTSILCCLCNRGESRRHHS